MNLHEYQGKELLASFGVTVQRGIVAKTVSEAMSAGKELSKSTGSNWYVIKAQIHAGGRGKGGGVKLAKTSDELEKIAGEILGMQLITPQTPKEGKKVNQVLIAEDVYYKGNSEPSEYYVSVLLNRGSGKNMIMYSTEGGMDIEAVAEKTPHLIFTEEVDPALGLQGFQARKIAFNLGLSGAAFKDIISILERRAPQVRLVLKSVKVQGDGSSRQICEAIELFNFSNSVDVIIIGRGGGSIEDLWAFNEEIVARTIFQSSIPIIFFCGGGDVEGLVLLVLTAGMLRPCVPEGIACCCSVSD